MPRNGETILLTLVRAKVNHRTWRAVDSIIGTGLDLTRSLVNNGIKETTHRVRG